MHLFFVQDIWNFVTTHAYYIPKLLAVANSLKYILSTSVTA